jgi:aspartate/methionine/tyrosine aminotransferase
VHYLCDETQGWQPDIADLESKITDRTKALVVINPNNPTGAVYSREVLEQIAELARKHQLLLLADEIYDKILYDDAKHIAMASVAPDVLTLTFNGLSKAYAMTGWRLGYVAGNAEYISEIGKVHSHSATCATSFAQAGGVAALTGPQEFIGEMVSAWKRRRDLITDGLNAVKGLKVQPIEGAFYAFVDGRETGMDSVALSERILQEAHVAVVPGTAFGDAGEGHFRLSFATSDDLLTGAVERITNLLGTR